MTKTPEIKIANPPKSHKRVFAGPSKRWPPVLKALSENPLVWHRLKGASYHDAIALRNSTVQAMRGAKFETKVRKKANGTYKVWARYVGLDGDNYL